MKQAELDSLQIMPSMLSTTRTSLVKPVLCRVSQSGKLFQPEHRLCFADGAGVWSQPSAHFWYAFGIIIPDCSFERAFLHGSVSYIYIYCNPLLIQSSVENKRTVVGWYCDNMWLYHLVPPALMRNCWIWLTGRIAITVTPRRPRDVATDPAGNWAVSRPRVEKSFWGYSPSLLETITNNYQGYTMVYWYPLVN